MIFVAIWDCIMYCPSHYPSHERQINAQNRSLIHLNSWQSTAICAKFDWDYAVNFRSQRRPLKFRKKNTGSLFIHKNEQFERGCNFFFDMIRLCEAGYSTSTTTFRQIRLEDHTSSVEPWPSEWAHLSLVPQLGPSTWSLNLVPQLGPSTWSLNLVLQLSPSTLSLNLVP